LKSEGGLKESSIVCRLEKVNRNNLIQIQLMMENNCEIKVDSMELNTI
jgi:hypothetical protein